VGAPVQTTIPLDELVKLCAGDPELYARTFFSRTFRQDSPSFAKEIWEPLENPTARLVNLVCFRGSSKTTRLRTFASRRLAYGTSRTILYVGASERDAIRSVTWLRNQVERNAFWSQTFALKRGSKWDETQIEIEHGTFGHSVWVLAAGVTGSLRGINFDDYRPDLIVIDDPQTDEMAATEEQRNKLTDLILGAVKNSLAPVTEEPNAKLVMAITPQHKEDISQQATRDLQWITRVFPCWTKDTLYNDVDAQVSSWPERFPTQLLRDDKRAAISRNKLSVFAKEMECRIVSSEKTHFRPNWLNVREGAAPVGGYAVLAIDPVPPPSERQMAKGLAGKDWEAHYVWMRHNGEYHLVDCARSRGHEPSWTVATAFSLARKWRVSKIVVDAVAYQKVLKWFLEQEMKRRGIYYVVVPIDDKMQKFARITSVIGGLATHGKLWIGAEHTVFAQQFEEYGPLYSGPDDDLDASALALQEISNPYLERGHGVDYLDDSDVEEFNYIGSCP
jgi:hypothetical protein